MNSADVFSQIVSDRYSVRGFKAEPVEQGLLEKVFSLAQHSPSNCNTQPWFTAVASGDKLDVLREKIPEAMMKGEISWDFPYDGKYEGEYQDRQYAAANALYSACGIERDDKPARDGQFFKNFQFFGAPHAAFLFLPPGFGIREAADLGMYAQTLMLSMKAHGIGSCPQTALSFTAKVIKEVLDVPEDYQLMFGISFGFIDENEPANTARTDRAGIDTSVKFVS